MNENAEQEMRRRTITLPDGRYLIFYEFTETLQSDFKPEGNESMRSETVVEETSV